MSTATASSTPPAKALSGQGNPSFATILKVTSALGIQLHAQSATPH